MTEAIAVPQEHILVVEDDRDLRQTLCEALQLEGYSAVCAENGQAALAHLATGARPCVILLDLMMPVMDGWTFRQEMMKDETLAAIPVVVMTAALPARVGAIGAAEILFKPLHMGTVVDMVQEHCPDGAF
ncbi:MAG TPA: response regulator [Polyangia bacterium]|nr:response regulator [Polyangia bacterium]